MFTIQDDDLLYNGEYFGPKTALYIDSNELKKLKGEGVVRRTMPSRIDMVFVAGDSVIGVESKKPGDLDTSIRAGRLARQMRTLMKEVDVPCLLLRNGSRGWHRFADDLFHVWVDIVLL